MRLVVRSLKAKENQDQKNHADKSEIPLDRVPLNRIVNVIVVATEIHFHVRIFYYETLKIL